ncbi:hypothetical protein ACFFNY_32925 [Paenibacillus hodogayensis]|uniref:Uncharacterized protein n=1 Tax=Paenibacillus hodogayensis TaxID=279208 RepID=A0ABV5W744_9BACL
MEVKIGINTTNIILPVRPKLGNNNIYINKEDWIQIFNSENSNNQAEQKFYYPEVTSDYDATQEIEDLFVSKYFLPGIQNLLFSKNGKFSAFRLKENSKIIKANFPECNQQLRFEWLSTELYKFSDKFAFLVVRVALLPEENNQGLIDLDDWIKFINRIRQNHNKYLNAPKINFKTSKRDNSHQNSDIFEAVSSIIDKYNLFISNKISTDDFDLQDYKLSSFKFIEPDNFIHACAQVTNLIEPKQLFRISSFDETINNYDEEFVNCFIKNNTYQRWGASGNYTIGNDNCWISLIKIDNPPSYKFNRFSSNNWFPDHYLQIFNKQYLIIALLNLFYREELQRLSGEYSTLENLNTQRSNARRILSSFDNLNLNYYFHKISNETQGIEMWNLFNNILGIHSLYNKVKEDMRELNQRLIEVHSELQNKETKTLTILAFFTGMLGINVLIEKKTTEISEYISNFIPTIDQMFPIVSFISLITFVIASLLFLYMLLNIFFIVSLFKERIIVFMSLLNRGIKITHKLISNLISYVSKRVTKERTLDTQEEISL